MTRKNYGTKQTLIDWCEYEIRKLSIEQQKEKNKIMQNLADLYDLPINLLTYAQIDNKPKALEDHPIEQKTKEAFERLDQRIADKKEVYRKLKQYAESTNLSAKTIVQDLEENTTFDTSGYGKYLNREQIEHQKNLDRFGQHIKKITNGQEFYL